MILAVRTRASALRRALLITYAVLAVAPAAAQETITYSYDARGRLVGVSRAGTVNNGVSAAYTYDAADNRTNVTVTGSGATTCSGVSFSEAGASANEGSTLSFTITKSGTTSDTCSVTYATANGSAVAGTNYTANGPTSLSFLSADTSKTVSVATIDDHVVTGDLNLYLNLTSPSGSATITTAQATGTIHNIDTGGTTTIQLASGTSENLRTIANNNGYTGSITANYTFVVGSGVTVVGSAGSGTGIDTGTWPSGVTLALQVNGWGIVRGGGGNGGAGGSGTSAGSVGGAGGDAIRCNAPISITVAAGGSVQAAGGGGGGGGGGGTNIAGAGGGGGAPNGTGGAAGTGTQSPAATAGSPGTTSGGGAGGTNGPSGGAGGTYATAGSAGTTASGAGGAGGGMGYAVRKNGTGCTATGAGTITGTVG